MGFLNVFVKRGQRKFIWYAERRNIVQIMSRTKLASVMP
jgi:hypothetical protein